MPHGAQITRTRRLVRARLCPTHARAPSIKVVKRGTGGRHTISPSSRYGARNARRRPPDTIADTMMHSTGRQLCSHLHNEEPPDPIRGPAPHDVGVPTVRKRVMPKSITRHISVRCLGTAVAAGNVLAWLMPSVGSLEGWGSPCAPAGSLRRSAACLGHD